MSKVKSSFGAAVKEKLRKAAVSLKRKPHMIPLAVLVFAFLWYSLQLTQVSDATAFINASGMGLCGFITMLFSILGLVCYGYSFPHRKKPVAWRLILTFLLFFAVIAADLIYMKTLVNRVYQDLAYSTAQETLNTLSVFPKVIRLQTKHGIVRLLTVHMVIVGAGLLLTALLPAYIPLLRKIKTSVNVVGNEDMCSIELAEDD